MHVDYQNSREPSSRSRIFLNSLLYLCIHVCHVSWPNEKRYTPEIWRTYSHWPYLKTFFFEKISETAASLKKLPCHVDFSHIFSIALFAIFRFFNRDFEALAFKIFELGFRIRIPYPRIMLNLNFQLITWKIEDFKRNCWFFLITLYTSRLFFKFQFSKWSQSISVRDQFGNAFYAHYNIDVKFT